MTNNDNWYGKKASEIVKDAKIISYKNGLARVIVNQNGKDFELIKSEENIHGAKTGRFILCISEVSDIKNDFYIDIDDYDNTISNLDDLISKADAKIEYSGYGYHGGGRKAGTAEKTSNLCIRCRPGELDAIKRNAESAGMTVSEYIVSKSI